MKKEEEKYLVTNNRVGLNDGSLKFYKTFISLDVSFNCQSKLSKLPQQCTLERSTQKNEYLWKTIFAKRALHSSTFSIILSCSSAFVVRHQFDIDIHLMFKLSVDSWSNFYFRRLKIVIRRWTLLRKIMFSIINAYSFVLFCWSTFGRIMCHTHYILGKSENGTENIFNMIDAIC